METQYLTVSSLKLNEIKRLFSTLNITSEISHNGTPCWIWTGSIVRGYGHLNWRWGQYTAHRFFWAWLIGPVPKGRKYGEFDHLCRRPACVNPVHLEWVTAKENQRRAAEAKIFCAQGHLRADNLWTDKRGHTVCKTCAREHQRRYQETHKEHIQQKSRKWHKDNRKHVNARALAYYHKRKALDPSYRWTPDDAEKQREYRRRIKEQT